MFSLTDSAKEYIESICRDHDKAGVMLSVKGGGCSGFTYHYDFLDTKEYPAGSFEVPLDSGAVFVVDSMSLLYVSGTVLDYTKSLAGNSLMVSNPMQKSGCGCGKSFSV
jgi:iron-sulfur cluster assembly accessory protein